MDFDHYEFTLAGHFGPALINGDESGLDEADCVGLTALIERIPAEHRKQGHWDGFAEEDSVGFARDEVSGLYADCYKARWYFPI